MVASPSPEKYLIAIITLSLISLLVVTATSYFFFSTPANPNPNPGFLDLGPTSLPSFAYYISGSRGDAGQILRLLLAIYHPRNRNLLHLLHEAVDKERNWLAVAVRVVVLAARKFGNVDVVGRGDAMTKLGSSALAATLRGAAVMLRMDRGWDWFVMLSVRDYRLVTQDGPKESNHLPLMQAST